MGALQETHRLNNIRSWKPRYLEAETLATLRREAKCLLRLHKVSNGLNTLTSSSELFFLSQYVSCPRQIVLSRLKQDCRMIYCRLISGIMIIIGRMMKASPIKLIHQR